MTFPTNVATFQNKVDLLDVIYAEHVNTLQTEVAATQATIGTTVLSSVYSESPSVDWLNPGSGPWTDLSARLANIERGLLNKEKSASLGLPYYRKAGGALDDTTTEVSFITKSATANDAVGARFDQIQTKTSAGANGFRVDYLAIPYYQTYRLLDTRDETDIYDYIDAQLANFVNINPLLIAGM